jgi:hypothetical protein
MAGPHGVPTESSDPALAGSGIGDVSTGIGMWVALLGGAIAVASHVVNSE